MKKFLIGLIVFLGIHHHYLNADAYELQLNCTYYHQYLTTLAFPSNNTSDLSSNFGVFLSDANTYWQSTGYILSLEQTSDYGSSTPLSSLPDRFKWHVFCSGTGLQNKFFLKNDGYDRILHYNYDTTNPKPYLSTSWNYASGGQWKILVETYGGSTYYSIRYGGTSPNFSIRQAYDDSWYTAPNSDGDYYTPIYQASGSNYKAWELKFYP